MKMFKKKIPDKKLVCFVCLSCLKLIIQNEIFKHCAFQIYYICSRRSAKETRTSSGYFHLGEYKN